jgi:hypothetical protein
MNVKIVWGDRGPNKQQLRPVSLITVDVIITFLTSVS